MNKRRICALETCRRIFVTSTNRMYCSKQCKYIAHNIKQNYRHQIKESTDWSNIYPGSELTPDDVELGNAMERWKHRTGNRFPAWSDVLYVLTQELGYKKDKKLKGGIG